MHILFEIPLTKRTHGVENRPAGDSHGDPRRSILRKRINRVLAKRGEKLILTRFAKEKEALGDAYIIRTEPPVSTAPPRYRIERNVDIEAYARTIGCAD